MIEMVCPYCGLRIRWLRHYYKALQEHEIDVYCKSCGRVVTLTSSDADRETELKMLPRHERYVKEGLCRVCGSRKPRKGLITCDKCIAETKKRHERSEFALKEAKTYGINAKLYAYRRSYGLCVICGEPAKNSAKLCEKCRKGKIDDV